MQGVSELYLHIKIVKYKLITNYKLDINMKKNLLKSAAMFFAACAASMSLTAQKVAYPEAYVVDIFDAMPRTWTAVSEDNALSLNPARQAMNTSTMVLKLQRTGATISGAETALALPAGQYGYAHIMMYSETAVTPTIKVNDTDAEIAAPAALAANTWTDVVFAIPAASAIDYLRVNIDNTADAPENPVYLYIDNVVLNNVSEATVKTIAANAAIEPFNYKSEGVNNQYALQNDWSYTKMLDNYTYGSTITFTTGSASRGMVEYNGKMYFPVRKGGTEDNPHQIAVVNGATGVIETSIDIPTNVFTYQLEVNAGTDSARIETAAVALPFNDVHKDQNGNLIFSNLVTSAAGPFEVWAYNVEAGTWTLVLHEVIAEVEGFADATVRFDAFGVYGSYPEHLVIMASNASKVEAYKWVIENGVSQGMEYIVLDDYKGYPETSKNKAVNPGTAPRIYPIDDEYFYLDGNATFPTLYNSEGTLIDNFYQDTLTAYSNISKSVIYYNSEVKFDTINFTMNEGHNGLQEFELTNAETGEKEYFLACAARNTVGTSASSYAIMKFADANKSFRDAEFLFLFPGNGMGGASNAYRTAAVTVENENDYTANLYAYTGENGIAKYTMINMELANKAKAIEEPVAVENTTVSANKVYVNNNVVTLDNKANVEVYSILGQKVAEYKNVNTFSLNSGMYIVVVDGVSNKVIIK